VADNSHPWSRIVADAQAVVDAAKRRDHIALVASLDKLSHLVNPNGIHSILTTEQVAEVLQVHVKTVYKYAKVWPFMQKLPGTSLYRAYRGNVEAHIKRRGESKRDPG
jgi:transposase